MLSLCLYLGEAVIVPKWPEIEGIPLAWILISLTALQYFKINMVVWIGLSAAAGLLLNLAGF